MLRLSDFFKDRDCPKEHLVLNISEYTATGVYTNFVDIVLIFKKNIFIVFILPLARPIKTF